MVAREYKLGIGIIAVVGLFCMAVVVGHAQSPGRAGTAPTASAQSGSSAAMSAEREQIWNSPNMLRARAWLQDYCSKSARVTPEMARQYQTELQNMTPAQLKLWLLKFDHEEEQRQQQYAVFQQAHSRALSQAMAADRATQQSYAAINREQSQAAGEEQQQLNEQQQAEQTEQENKQIESAGPYGPYGSPGYGGVHYHFHLYPY